MCDSRVDTKSLAHVVLVARGLRCPGEVGGVVAPGRAAVLHRAQLRVAPLAQLVHGDLRRLHPVDCHLLLCHGVDGKP